MKQKKMGPVIGSTLYSDGTLVAEDVTITLPAVTFVTFDIQAGGTVSVPTSLVENMEMSVEKIGIDKGFKKLIKPGATKLESRWVAEEIDNEGNKKVIGYKAFMKGFIKEIPAPTVTIGEAQSSSLSYTITRYELQVDGKQHLLIDKFNHKVKIDGVDVVKSISNLL